MLSYYAEYTVAARTWVFVSSSPRHDVGSTNRTAAAPATSAPSGLATLTPDPAASRSPSRWERRRRHRRYRHCLYHHRRFRHGRRRRRHRCRRNRSSTAARGQPGAPATLQATRSVARRIPSAGGCSLASPAPEQPLSTATTAAAAVEVAWVCQAHPAGRTAERGAPAVGAANSSPVWEERVTSSRALAARALLPPPSPLPPPPQSRSRVWQKYRGRPNLRVEWKRGRIADPAHTGAE